MPIQVVPINNLHQAGLILDTPAVSLPPNVFSDGNNVRFRDGAARKIEGEIAIATSSNVGDMEYLAWWPNPNKTPNGGYYVAVVNVDGGQKVFAVDAVTFDPQDITPTTANFTTVTSSSDTNWTHTLFAGGFAIVLNNGVEAPHYIMDDDGNTGALPRRLAPLPGWDSYIVNETLREATFTVGSEYTFDVGQVVDFSLYSLEVSRVRQGQTVIMQPQSSGGTGTTNAADFVPPTYNSDTDYNVTGDNYRIYTNAAGTSTTLEIGTGLAVNDTLKVAIKSRQEVLVRAGVVRSFGDLLVAGDLTEYRQLPEERDLANSTAITGFSDTQAYFFPQGAGTNLNRFDTYYSSAPFTIDTDLYYQATAEVTHGGRDHVVKVYSNGSDMRSFAGGTNIEFNSVRLISYTIDGVDSENPQHISTGTNPGWDITELFSSADSDIAVTPATDFTYRRLAGVVRTSDVAPPGQIPANWNPFFAGANTADEITLSETGQIQDMVPLQGNLYIYTNQSIHSLQLTGSTVTPIATNVVTNQYGAQTTEAVLEFDGKHFVVGSNDIYVFAGHPGNIQSLADGRVRKYFFDNLSTTNESGLFCLRNQARDEIWVCFPTTGTRADTALIWNYKNNTWTKRDLPNVTNGVTAPVVGGEHRDWDTDEVNPNRLFPVFSADSDNIIVADLGYTMYNGDSDVNYTSYLERRTLPLSPEFDVETVHELALWTEGNTNLDIYMLGSNAPGETITFSTRNTVFDTNEDYKADLRVNGRFMNLRIEESQPQEWVLSGLQVGVMKGGKR